MMLGICWDNESTGLCLHPDARISLQPYITEVGGALIDERGEVLEELSLLIKPPIPVSEEITKITGITNEMLEGQPTFEEAYPRIKAIIEKADVFICHNEPFDRFLLELELQRAGINDFCWPTHRLCTVQAYYEQYGKRPRLVELYEDVIGRPLAQTHRALDDVKALAEVVVKEQLLTYYVKGTESCLK
jgi:DNA polymerase III epsilon subunit-like protein